MKTEEKPRSYAKVLKSLKHMAKKARKNILKLNKEDLVIMICQEGLYHKEGHLFPSMDLMVIVFLVLTLVIRISIVDSMEE